MSDRQDDDGETGKSRDSPGGIDERGLRFATRAVTAGERPRAGPDETGDVTMPIHLSSTYAVEGLDPDMDVSELDPDAGEYVYSRLSNPTRNALENRMAALEGGEHALAFASGTSAMAATMLAVVDPGDHLVAFDDLYGGTKKMLEGLFVDRLDVEVEFVDATDVENVRSAARPETKLIWMETPTNPLMKLCDVGAIAGVADDVDAVLAVDNTFMSPYFQNPLGLGADVVVHSTTKFVNGHSDSVGGAVVLDDDEIADEMAFLQQVGLGNVMSPFDAYQVLRGSKTLPVRMRQHEGSAVRIARFLADHDAVETVHYPGLESHPQHKLASEQMSGYGGVLSFELATDFDGAETFLQSLDEVTLAVSLGGVESLVEHPASMTHSALTPEERAEIGIGDALIRMSVGIEDVEDLLDDLESALAATPVRRAESAPAETE